MNDLDSEGVTAALKAWGEGDHNALNAVMPELYRRLKQIALRRLRGSKRSVVDPTELVNEAMVALLGRNQPIANRAHFLALAALQMRTILVDEARAKARDAMPNGDAPITMLTTRRSGVEGGPDVTSLLALDEALTNLARQDERAARVLELQCFGGLARDEIANVVRISVPTVDRDLRYANAFVNRALQ
jgi:RNA polymerase sigma factor (TIGR02999 family)